VAEPLARIEDDTARRCAGGQRGRGRRGRDFDLRCPTLNGRLGGLPQLRRGNARMTKQSSWAAKQIRLASRRRPDARSWSERERMKHGAMLSASSGMPGRASRSSSVSSCRCAILILQRGAASISGRLSGKRPLSGHPWNVRKPMRSHRHQTGKAFACGSSIVMPGIAAAQPRLRRRYAAATVRSSPCSARLACAWLRSSLRGG